MPYTIPKDIINDVKSLINKGISLRNIAKATGVSKSTVHRIKSAYFPTVPHTSPGRPSNISQTTSHALRFKVRQGYLKTARQVQMWLFEVGISLSYRATLNLMKRLGLYAQIKQKRVFLRNKHIQKRLKWAKQYQNWTVEDWKKVIFSDETKINLWGSDGIVYTWRQKGYPAQPHNYKQVLKHGGGSLMMRGCITSFGPGYASRILQNTMDSECYIEILETSYMDTLAYYGLNKTEYILQQDGDTKHTSRMTKKWLERNHVKHLCSWPPNSPDLNPIENLWYKLKSKLGEYQTHAKNINELWERVEVEWYKLTKEDMEPYYNSMPSRIEAVIKAKGGYTKYYKAISILRLPAYNRHIVLSLFQFSFKLDKFSKK